MQERERERERVIRGWQVGLLACTLAIFACLTFASVPAFADEGGDPEAELQVATKTTNITPGKTFETASTIQFSSDVNLTNTFSTGSDVGYSEQYYFKIVLDKDGYINFPDNFLRDGESDYSTKVFYHSDTGHTNFWATWNCYDCNLGLAKGTYYLSMKISSSSTYTCKFNFRVSDAWEKESNDSFDTANTINLNKVYYGSNADETYYDYFKFYVSGTVQVTMEGTSTDWTDYYFYKDNDAHDQIKWTRWSEGSFHEGWDTNELKPFTLTQGWYYLRVQQWGYDEDCYSFKINAKSVSNVTMHRLYNRWTGEHFYTSSSSEKDGLVKKGWSYEGVGWTAPSTSSQPVYRLYNKYVSGGDHHYTMDESEKNDLVKKGWSDEGIGWYSDPNEGVPLYRQYNPYAKTGTHNYTTSKSENDNLVNKGWRAEGVSWYGVK